VSEVQAVLNKYENYAAWDPTVERMSDDEALRYETYSKLRFAIKLLRKLENLYEELTGLDAEEGTDLEASESSQDQQHGESSAG
jgi:hypothetical protein